MDKGDRQQPPGSTAGAPLFRSGVTFAAVALAYLIGAEIGHWLSAEPGHFSTFWPNSGLYLALLLRTPPRRWWVVAAAAAAANLTSDVLLHDRRPAVALGFALANTVEAVVGAVVVRRWLGGAARLDGLRSVLVVFLAAAAVSAPLGGLVGAATVSTAFGTSLLAAWQVWWVADALGVLLTVPLVLGLLDTTSWPRPARLLEGAALFAGLVAAGTVVFTATPPAAPIVLLLFLLWAAIRLDVPGVAAAAFVLAVVAVRCTVLGHGIFTGTGDIARRIVSVQLFVAVPAFVFYAFAVVLAERRQAEAGLEEKVRERTAALLAQRELLSVTLTSIGDAVVTTDTACRVVQLNPVAESLTGWATAAAAGRPLDAVFRIVHETTREPVESPAFRALKEGAVVGLASHTVLIARDGAERPIEDSAAPIRSRGGEVVGCVLVFRDVTDRRRAEARERATWERFRLAADAVNGIIYEFDFATGHVERTRGLHEVLGYHADEVPPTAAWWWEQTHPDDREVNRRRFEAATGNNSLTGGTVANEYRVRHKDGRWVFVEDRAVLMRGDDGRLVKMVGCTVDVTARKQAEGRLRDREQFIRSVLDASPGVIYLFDLDARRTEFINQRVRSTLGLTPEQVVGEGERFMENRVHPDDLPALRSHTERVAALADGELLSAEYRMRHADGRWVWFASRDVVFARGPDGRASKVLGVATDMTARRRAEEEARRRAEEFQVLLDTLPVGVFVAHDPEGRTITGNRAAQDLLRAPARELSLTAPPGELPTNFRVRRNGVELPADQLPVQRAARGEVVVNEEVELAFDDGRVVSELVSAAPLYDSDGRVRGAVAGVLDITARKRAEEERERTAAALKSLIASAPVGIALFDADMRYRHVNGPLAEMNGAPVEAHLGKTPAEIVPDLCGLVRTLFDRVLGSGETVPDVVVEGETPRAPGVKRVWRESWFPVLGADGRPSGVGAIVQEITEQRRLERERENSQRTLAALVEQCPFGIYLVDADFRIAAMNTGSQNKAFANVRPLIGRPFDEAMRVLWPEPVATDCINIFRHTLATGEPYCSQDFVNPRADTGQTEGYEWELHRITLPDGRYGVVCYYFDATPLRRAEAALRDSEGHFRSMADNAPAMLWVTDPAGSCTYISRQWCEFTGTTAERNLGLGWLACVHPDDVPRAEADFVSANARRQPFRIEYRLRRHDGEYRWAVDAAMPRFDGGAFVGYVGCVFDVHDRRTSEDGLREADRKKDEFLATLAHELRNPLAPIRNGVQILKLAGDKPEAVERWRGMIERQVEQMAHLIDDLMDLSRINQGKIALQRNRMPLAEAIRDAVDASRPLIERQGHELALSAPDAPIFVDGDHTRLTQVFANLLNNAAKYTDPGGRIRLAVGRQGGEAVVSVEDTGVGIPADMLPRVFDMFTQVDRSLEKSQGGLGIGLNIVKKLVEMHGGTVGVVSPGHAQGSVFTVRLPLALSPAVAPEREGRGPVAARRRILVVDDNEDGATSLAEMLDIMGNVTHTAHDGLEAVSAAETFKPDVILMDIGMPRLNGFDACRRIREQPWGKAVVVVAQTGWGQDDDKEKAREAGFDLHMTKPVDPVALDKLLAGLAAAP